MRTVPKPAVLMADKLAKEYVHNRDGWRCLCCGKRDTTETPLEWAHIITKGMGGGNRFIRWDPDNAVTLCHEDHEYFTRYPARFRSFVATLFGADHWDTLKRRQAEAERRGGHVDIDAVIRGFRVPAMTAEDRERYGQGEW